MDALLPIARDHMLSPAIAAIVVFAIACGVAFVVPSWIKHVRKRVGLLASLTRRRASIIEASLEESIPAVTKELDFPEDWYTSDKLFQLEKRAIFSKTWLHVCHSSLFSKAGDYRTFQIASFSFVVILGKDGRLRAFHNVCRHRAYTVATKEAGSCLVLRCKYHGWSYDTQGKLIKAPKFEDVAGFDKSQNGLYEIRTFIDSSGFVYVNFDVYGSDGLTIRVGVPIRANLSLVESWSIETNFNWKIATPSGAFRVRSLNIDGLSDMLGAFMGGVKSWRFPSEFELSPLTHLLRSRRGNLWLTISIIPATSTNCTISCSLYCSELELKSELPVTAIKSEVQDSITKLQFILEESQKDGSIQDPHSQEPFLAEIKAHSRLERLTRGEVHPASRLRETSQACRVADDLCKQLEVEAQSSGQGGSLSNLAW